jgi:hypothetical protein
MRFSSIIRRSAAKSSPGPAAAFADATATKCPQSWEPHPTGEICLCDPPLPPRDEAILLLHATSEVEHSLMVQYLYAAYSVGDPVPVTNPPDPRAPKIELIRYLLLHIAREEMAHLATVQNLLRVLGGPLHLDREHSPFASQLLPFRFKLEQLSLGSLAKYVVAESPRPLPPDDVLSSAEKARILGEVTDKAKASNDGVCVGHVGDIFARLLFLFRPATVPGDADLHLRDSDFLPNTGEYQAQWNDWGYDPKRRNFGQPPTTVDGEPSLVSHFPDPDPAEVRKKAIRALEQIADQGEGADAPAQPLESHFEWFWLLYKTFDEVSKMPGGMPVHAVPTNPNTSSASGTHAPHYKMIDAGMEAHVDAGRIMHVRSRRWAQLFNLRYRLLLTQLHHFLRINEPRYDATGDRTARGYLLLGIFNEMRRLRKIARKLVLMPFAEPADSRRAAPPFELPYTTQLPDGERERWARHLDASRTAGQLLIALLKDPTDAADEFLLDVQAQDEKDRQVMTALSDGQPLPPQSQDFPKVVRILEEAVRGFTIFQQGNGTLYHGNFWGNQPRGSDATGATDGFVNSAVGQPNPTPILQRNPDGTFNATESNLIRRLKGDNVASMPRERPAVPLSRVEYIQDWVARNCPDTVPPYPGLTREREPRPETAPTPPATTAPTFNADIRPLFRASDVSCMKAIAGFDLSVYADVKARATPIFQQLDGGFMPTDGRWPQANIDRFKQWIDAGMPEL